MTHPKIYYVVRFIAGILGYALGYWLAVLLGLWKDLPWRMPVEVD